MTYSSQNLRDIFQSKFNQQEWYQFLKNFFKATELKSVPEKIIGTSENEQGYYLGNIETSDSYRIGLFQYDIMKGDVARKRVGLRNLVKTFVNPSWGEFDAALVVFDGHDSWRLSFVCDIKGENTSPKRYTFVFGAKNNYYNTPVSRFLGLQNIGISFKSINEAFSVEALTKEFYNKLFEWYQWAVSPESGTYFPNDTNTSSDDFEDIDKKMIRLLTRLMFVWFIKQKELVPNTLFDESFLSKILKDFDPYSSEQGNYYNAILQNLFFATLNRAIEDEEGKRGFAHLKGQRDVKTLYRYAEMFTMSEDDVINLFADIPFLNGGLFECLDKTKKKDGVEKAYNYDGFSRNDNKWPNGRYRQRAFVPNILFFDKEKGLLSILKQYNFTIEENTPTEQQVALDPELLGKVFENLLGAYNPETKETARNQSGSFYTPREIVNYMVDESIKTYLSGKSDISKADVKELLSDTFTYDAMKKQSYDNIASHLLNIKFLDPACGSGAFPMGLLNRMVDILQKIIQEKSTYELKLSIIENCIYGSDIQNIATQISKLRFFISLICDCEKDSSKPNFGIPTLPNLETKFVTSNSLISLKKHKKNDQLDIFADSEFNPVNTKKEELHEVRKKHFRAKTANEKISLRKKDERLRGELLELLEKDEIFAPEDARQMALWNPYDQNAVSPFFDPEWMFDVADGFDVVIGNPPYISTKGVSVADKEKYEIEFGFSDDTYNLFTFKGLSLTRVGGSLSYIIPKTFWTTQTKRNMRDLILGNQINYIFDTANPFDAVMVDTCIIQVVKKQRSLNHEIQFLDGTKNLTHPIIYKPIKQDVYLNTQNSVIFKPTSLNLRIYELYGEKVKELYDKWWDKIETSKKIAQNKVELEAYRASLKPGDIALLGCLTEGGQGLATANNGKYVAVRRSTKWANNILESRPKKLAEAIKKKKIHVPQMDGFANERDFLNSLTEHEIADLFDSLKEKYGRDIFGQGYIYKIIEDSELADVEELTKDEKENGIDPSKNYYVPYDKGDKDGNRWYLETPFAIAWSKENVHFLKTNSGKKGEGMPVVRNPQFYFREGLCWSDINTTYLKCRKKERSIHDVKSMSIFGVTDIVPEDYIITLINSTFISYYVDNFVNNTQTFQINDARQLPIIVPNNTEKDKALSFVNKAIQIKKTNDKFNNELEDIQNEVDEYVKKIYNL